MPRLLLASASPARLAILRRAGVEPLVRTSGVDEEAELGTATQQHGELAPDQAALILARAKAEAVATQRRAESQHDVEADDRGVDDAVIILGCDSVLEFAGQAWGKPGTIERARERWLQMSGRRAVLHTGHWLIDENGDRMVGATASTEVEFASVSSAEIDAYVATQEPLNVAGGFTIDGLGGWFIERISGDHHAVVGLSLPLVRKLLADIDIAVADLWG